MLTAGGLTGWLAVTAAILLRRPDHGRIYRSQFTRLQVTLDRDQLWELDGDVMGSTRQLTVVAQPGGLLLRMPPRARPEARRDPAPPGPARSPGPPPDRRPEVVEFLAAMGAVLLRPGFVVEGIDRHDDLCAVTGGPDVEGRQVLVRLVVGHEVDQ